MTLFVKNNPGLMKKLPELRRPHTLKKQKKKKTQKKKQEKKRKVRRVSLKKSGEDHEKLMQQGRKLKI